MAARRTAGARLLQMSHSLPSAFSGLLRPEAYPHAVDAVEIIETHISWVLLAGRFAYKIKRPVRFPFVDLRAPERRRFFCEEELRLNRRFAPELYVEVCGISRRGGEACIGDREGAEEYAVRMRRFPAAEELDRLLDARRIEPHELEAFGRALAQTHARLPAAPAASTWGDPAQTQALMVRNLLECAQAAAVFGSAADVFALRGPLERKLPSSAPWMAARRAAGRIRECHGDLHSRNIVRYAGRLVAFDCLEYEPSFRWIDLADEIAFLTSDLGARARPLHAHAFRGGYLAESGDYHACRVLRLYEAHRALVRAKVAALSAAGCGEAEREALHREFNQLVNHADAALAGQIPRLLLMSGLSGSGKTWLARQLAERLLAVHVRSDVERKRRAGLRAYEASRSGVGEGLYSSRSSAAVYEDLAKAAEDALIGGIPIIIDAAFLKRDQRSRFVELAAGLGVPLRLVHCEAPDSVLRARIGERGRMRHDASEATTAVLDWQKSHAEPVTADEEIEVVRVDTTADRLLERTLREIGRRGTLRGRAPADGTPPGRPPLEEN